ncbi:PspC domain-containing protein [Miniimonas arenae]|uniref:PspC domain-containing protein n=1 Tax=Miniimonas arenae TaxID=676201 RepID=A0A5C5BBL4_9MICO|nr:PspC domain-containing protein [Miniimonas arenae]TNU74966.1 PspC domain-containing protein [Miniimonas arenae]
MTSTGPSPDSTGTSGATGTSGRPAVTDIDSFFAWVRSLGVTRSQERWIGGVAGGLATRWNLDPLVVRGTFAASILLGGIGFLVYGLAWALLPEPDGRIHAQGVLRGSVDQAVWGIAAFVIAGLGPANWFGLADGWFWGVLKGLGWAALALGVLWLVQQHRAGTLGTTGCSPASTPTSASPPPGSTTTGPAPFATASSPSGTTSEGAPAGATTSPTWGSPEPPVPVAGDVTDAPAPASAPAPAPVPAPAPGPTTQPHPKKARPGPGGVTVALVLGAAGLTAAALLIADRTGALDVTRAVVIGAVLAVLGLGIVVSGIRGRRGGALSTLAIVGLVLAPASLAQQDALGVDWDGPTSFSSTELTPTSRAAAEDGVRVIAGNAVVDLTEVPLTGDPVVVPIRVGAGEAVVTIPEDAAVRADVSIGAGEVVWDVEGAPRTVDDDGVGRTLTYRTTAADDGEAQLVLDVQVGAGTVTIQGASS